MFRGLSRHLSLKKPTKVGGTTKLISLKEGVRTDLLMSLIMKSVEVCLIKGGIKSAEMLARDFVG